MSTTVAPREMKDPEGAAPLRTESRSVTLPPGAPATERVGIATLLTVLAGTFMSTLDMFIVNVAVPSIQSELHASTSAIQWIVAGYSLAIGILVVVCGRLGDRFGARRIYGVGLAAFAVMSAACGFAPTAEVLVLARIGQGAAAALMAPQALAIIRTVFTGKALLRGFTAYGLIMGLAAVFGQIIGGALISFDVFGLGWRSCFLINVPVGVLALLALTSMVPGTPGRRAPRGAAVINLSILRRPRFVLAVLGQATFGAGLTGFFFVFALYAQTTLRLGPVESGVLFSAIGIGYIVTSSVAGRVQQRLGRRTAIVGAVGVVVGLAGLLAAVVAVHPAAGSWWGPLVLVPGLSITGAGMGLVISPLAALAMGSARADEAGTASGMVSTIMQLAGAGGVGLVGGVFAMATTLTSGQTPFVAGLLALIALNAATAVLVRVATRSRWDGVAR